MLFYQYCLRTKVIYQTFFSDVDGDGTLSENEFADPDLNEVPDGISPEEFRKERLKEFHNVLDEDGNGKVERKEYIVSFNIEVLIDFLWEPLGQIRF